MSAVIGKSDIKPIDAQVPITDIPIDGKMDVIAKADYIGITESAQFKVVGDVMALQITYDYTDHKTKPGTIITLEHFASLDGGLTWEGAGSSTHDGTGIIKPELDQNTVVCVAQKTYIDANGKQLPYWKNAIFKTIITVQGQSINTKVEFSPKSALLIAMPGPI